jgi:hypothetical protein
VEGTDLIYEGITTGAQTPFPLFHKIQEGTDLIYEGITTSFNSCSDNVFSPVLWKELT